MELDFSRHCSHIGCAQISLLPMKCEFCEKEFCRSHLFVDNHNCPQFQTSNRISACCPICGQMVVVKPSENLDCKVNQHIEFGCRIFKPAFTPQMKKENKCSFPHCKEICWAPITCFHCKRKFCTSHHIPETHNCLTLTASVAKHRSLLSNMSRSEVDHGSLNIVDVDSEALNIDVLLCSEVSIRKKVEEKTFNLPLSFSIGRTVDFIAKKEGILNNNNVPGMKKLCLFLDNSTEPLMMQLTLAELKGTQRGSSHVKLRFDYCAADQVFTSSLSSTSSPASCCCSSSLSSSSCSSSSTPTPSPSSLLMTTYFCSLFTPNTPMNSKSVK